MTSPGRHVFGPFEHEYEPVAKSKAMRRGLCLDMLTTLEREGIAWRLGKYGQITTDPEISEKDRDLLVRLQPDFAELLTTYPQQVTP